MNTKPQLSPHMNLEDYKNLYNFDENNEVIIPCDCNEDFCTGWKIIPLELLF